MLKIDQNTKISAIIKANAESVQAIAGIAKPFQKLKNPILRRLMAPRVTVAEAASIGGCTVQDFARVLAPLGFVFDDTVWSREKSQAGSQEPAWFSTLCADTTDTFDVRQLIAGGDDPLKQIMQRYGDLPQGHALCIINTFIPYPLVDVLSRKGAQHYSQTKAADVHYSWFFKSEVSPLLKSTKAGCQMNMLDQPSFESVLARYASKQTVMIDVRQLPMPQPMTCILDALLSLEGGHILYVYHKQIPLHLLEELEGSAFQIKICTYHVDDIRLLINHATY